MQIMFMRIEGTRKIESGVLGLNIFLILFKYFDILVVKWDKGLNELKYIWRVYCIVILLKC